MPLLNYQWIDVKYDSVQVKFVANLNIDTLVNANFPVVYSVATPVPLVDPFLDIEVERDYSPVSRILTLWWRNRPAPNSVLALQIRNLQNFLGSPIADFDVPFSWTESATPSDGLFTVPPDRTPIEVEDYSIKDAGWTIIDSSDIEESTVQYVEILDIAPGIMQHSYLQETENYGRIDLLFSIPIAANYVNPTYFSLTRKPVKKGMAQWEFVNSLVESNLDSSIVTVYLPSVEVGLESATPVYSKMLTDEEISAHVFFEKQYKYRLIVSKAVGS